jgi:hypothetical protein
MLPPTEDPITMCHIYIYAMHTHIIKDTFAVTETSQCFTHTRIQSKGSNKVLKTGALTNLFKPISEEVGTDRREGASTLNLPSLTRNLSKQVSALWTKTKAAGLSFENRRLRRRNQIMIINDDMLCIGGRSIAPRGSTYFLLSHVSVCNRDAHPSTNRESRCQRSDSILPRGRQSSRV